MKIRYLAVLGCFIFIAAILIYGHKTRKAGSLKLITVKTGNAVFLAEMASDWQKHEKGLSDRKQMPQNQAMLFVNLISPRPAFWMKEMKFPIDIVWIKNHQVVGLNQNLPPAGKPPLALYRPKTEVDAVLEINAGLAEHYRIKEGESVEYNPDYLTND